MTEEERETIINKVLAEIGHELSRTLEEYGDKEIEQFLSIHLPSGNILWDEDPIEVY